jgi:sugar phosphate isomerase/epimerase
VCGLAAGCNRNSLAFGSDRDFKISLAQWSFHKKLFASEMDNLDFAAESKRLGFEGIEYVNAFFKDKAADAGYLAQMKKRAADAGIKSLLIMCDGEGSLGDPDTAKRQQAVENHHKWVDAARTLGCHSIRVNAASEGSYDEQMKLAADGLRNLCVYAKPMDINVIVENHWGLSSQGTWLPKVIEMTGMDNCGTLPDFGNFPDEVDRYEAVGLMMPFAKAVSAKSYDFDADGNETKIDYDKMMEIVLSHGYRGYVGVEYEGDRLSEEDGIIATRKLLEKIRSGQTAEV